MNFYTRLSLALFGLFASIQVSALPTVFDVTDVTATITNAVAVILTVGAAVLVVWVTVKGFKWIRGAM